MTNLFSKHLHLCFFNKHLKHPTILSHPSPPSTPTTTTTTTTTTFHFNATYSLYDATTSSSALSTEDYFSSSSDSDSVNSPPDFASVFASQRFFFSSPGTSNSIIESPDTRPSKSTETMPISGGLKVRKYSLNPYIDFLHSMQEMIHSRHQLLDVARDWDYLHDLLLSYLALNPPHTHKYIVRAFTDLVVDLLSSPPPPPPPPVVAKHKNRRHCSFSGQLV